MSNTSRSSGESALSTTESHIVDDVKSHDYKGAQDEVNHYRQENNGQISASDESNMNSYLHSSGFPNLDIVDAKVGSSTQSFIVSKAGEQTEQQVVSTIQSNPTGGAAAANQFVANLKSSEASDPNLFNNDISYINAVLANGSMPQFQQTGDVWALNTPPPSPPPEAAAAPQTAPQEAPEAPASASGSSGYSGASGDAGSTSGGSSSGGSSSGAASENFAVSPTAAAAQSGGTASIDQFATELLEMLGLPVTAANLQFFEAWQKAEGGSPGATGGDAAYNPFNTTQGEAGSTPINSVGVQSFTSLATGLQATAATLENGHYGNILSALQQGTSAMADAQAVAASPWGTGQGVVNVLNSG